MRLLFLFILVSLHYITHSQNPCTGNLGDNIFTEGDFGRGNANIVLTDPGIAPGFQYVTTVPFDDGKYTITNSTALWPAIWPTWLLIGDNSSDPQGYMMVVNASYTPGIFYEQTVDDLCDNTLYTFTADVINIVRHDVLNHILPNVSFLIDGEEKFTTGAIPQSDTWNTYGFTFSTAPGQEQVTLTLRNNAPGGIGNDLALDNISFRPCGPSATITIDMEGRVCENVLYPQLTAVIASDTGHVQWQFSADAGTTWSDIPGATDRTYRSDQLNAGNYLFRYLYGRTAQHLQNPKCRIVSASKSLEVVPVNFTIVDTLCKGLSFDLGGTEYSATGTYFEHLTALNGCDSIVTLHLTIVEDPDIDAEILTMPPSCFGWKDGHIAAGDIVNGFPPYTLSAEGLGMVTTDEAISVGAGQYSVTITDRFGCIDEHVVEIVDPEQFIIEIAGNKFIYLGYTSPLLVSGNYPVNTIQWQPDIGLLCATCPVTEAMPLQTSIYVATATSEKGCTAIDSFLIIVDESPRVFIPNIFSPNGDNINDSWGIMADPLNIPEIERIVIFDRWGGVLFEASYISSMDADDLWDGRIGDETVQTGTYVYIIEMRLANEARVVRSGTVAVIK